MKYRLKADITALYSTEDTLRILVIPEDTVVEVCGEEYSAGLVNVRFGDLVVAAFAGDLQARGHKLVASPAVISGPLDDKIRDINKAIELAMRARA